MAANKDNTSLAALLADPNIFTASGAGQRFEGTDAAFDIVSFKNAPFGDNGSGVVAKLLDSSSLTTTSWGAGAVYLSIEGLEGSWYADTLMGNGGDNRLYGGKGSDTLIGGGGNDTYVGSALDGAEDVLDKDLVSYQYAAASIVVNLADRTKNAGDAAGDTFVAIEGIIGTAYGDYLKGDNGDNILKGGAGNDTISGGLGRDQLFGGDGIDLLTFADATGAVNASLNAESGSDEDNRTDSYKEFENILGSNYRDTLSGDSKDNVVDGGAENDILVGYGGNDTLIGGTGTDDMQGLEGNDVYYVDNALDYVRERSGNGFDHVITTATFDLEARGDGEVEVFQAAAGNAAINLYGNYHTNRIIGNDANNVIDGRKGADTMEGGAGDDIYYVDDARDVVIDTQGNNIVYTKANFSSTQLTGRVIATGTTSISLKGDATANVIKGNNGNNKINGGAGNDQLYGLKGKDAFIFNTKLNSKTNKDKILDWNYKDDTIQLENKIFTKLKKTGTLNKDYFVIGSKAKDANDFVGYNKKTGDLWYDTNGSKSGGQYVFANIGKNKAIFHNDFVII